MAPCNGTTSTPPMAPRPLLQSWSSPPPQPSHTTMAPHYNGTTSTPPKLAVTPPTIAPSKLVITLPPNHRTLQWHHTTMAPCNGTQQWQHVHSTKVGRHPLPNHNTLQWHPTKAPSNGTTSNAPCNGTQQWHHVHSTIAHYNGTLQRHPAMAPRPLHPAMAMAPRPLNHSTLTLQWHPATAPSNGTTSTAPCNGILVPRPMRKSGSSPSPSIGSKNPYSYRYLGKKGRRSGNRSFFSGQVATSVNVVGERDKCSEQNKNKAFDKNCSFGHVHIQLR